MMIEIKKNYLILFLDGISLVGFAVGCSFVHVNPPLNYVKKKDNEFQLSLSLFFIWSVLIKQTQEEGPCFLVYNHSSRSDYIWISQSISPRRANFVTGYNEFFRSKFKGIFDILHQIPKKNFTNDMICMKGMKRVIDKGGIVAFSPEGMSCVNGHNQPVVPGTGKLFKHYNIPVYCLHISGGFFNQPQSMPR